MTQQNGHRWTQLLEDLRRDAVVEQQLGDDYSESSGDLAWDHANQHWGRAAAFREVIIAMEAAEDVTVEVHDLEWARRTSGHG